MRDHNGIERAIAERPEVWQGIFAFFLRMHAAVEDEPLLGGLDIVTIGADLGAACEVDELQISILVLALTRALALSPNNSASPLEFEHSGCLSNPPASRRFLKAAPFQRGLLFPQATF